MAGSRGGGRNGRCADSRGLKEEKVDENRE